MGPRWVRPGLLALAVAIAAACQSPTLPLPPPSTPVVTQTAADEVEVYGSPGSALPGALVMVFNDDTGQGVITTASGVGEFRARVGVSFHGVSVNANTLEIWQRQGNGDSPPITYLVRPRR